MTIFILGIVFILYVLIGYPLLVTLWSRARPQPVTKQFIPRTISIILPVHNGERWLAEKLRAIRELNYPQDLIQTIVVSNARPMARWRSPDSFGVPDEGIAIEQSGKARALNAGLLWRKARSRFSPMSGNGSSPTVCALW